MEWRQLRLKYLVHYRKGKSPKDLTDKDKGFLPYLSMEYLRGNPKQTFYVQDGESCVEAIEDDILLLWDGSNAGEFIRAKKGILSSTMAVIKPLDEKIDKEFLWFYLKSIESELKDSTIGMGIPHVNGDDFSNMVIDLPNEVEQKKNCKFFDC